MREHHVCKESKREHQQILGSPKSNNLKALLSFAHLSFFYLWTKLTFLKMNTKMWMLQVLCVCICAHAVQARIWAWMLSIPYSASEDGPVGPRDREAEILPNNPKGDMVTCEHDRACGKGFSCDRHFGLCVPLRQEGQYCRRDAQCVRGLSCMFGRCIRSIPDGQEGARCKLDRECDESMCCARHHGERVCKQRLVLGESCFVPDGGLAFSINQICPCDEGLLCRGHGEPMKREREFVYHPDATSWTCQAPKP